MPINNVPHEHYKAPTLEEISHKLSSATVFSKLDAKDGFWSIHLDTTSSYLTTFNTHKGHYQYLCMPLGLKMSQDVFQMCMDQITNRLSGIIAIHNDICVYGKTRKEHNTNLLQVMKTASKNGLVFNSHKCSIRQLQITFYGAIFTSKGMKPDPTKIQALQDLPTPDNHTVTVIFRFNQLFTVLFTQFGFQDHLFKGTNFKLGLESFHQHSISKT